MDFDDGQDGPSLSRSSSYKVRLSLRACVSLLAFFHCIPVPFLHLLSFLLSVFTPFFSSFCPSFFYVSSFNPALFRSLISSFFTSFSFCNSFLTLFPSSLSISLHCIFSLFRSHFSSIFPFFLYFPFYFSLY